MVLLLWLLWPVFPAVVVADPKPETVAFGVGQTPGVGAWFLFIPLLVLQVLWVHRFLTRIRPRLKVDLSHHLGVTIVDGPKGSWAAAPGSGLARGVLVGAVDITLLIGATLGPLAIVSVLLVLLAG